MPPLPRALSVVIATALLAPSVWAVGVAEGAPPVTSRAEKDTGAGVKPKATVAQRVFYSGRVQGVGFRATTADIARDYPVTGWVKNLDDGRVQLVVEGPSEAVQAFLKAVHQRWQENIDKEQVEEQKVTGKYTRFEVVR